jgi:hypothetical protein
MLHMLYFIQRRLKFDVLDKQTCASFHSFVAIKMETTTHIEIIMKTIGFMKWYIYMMCLLVFVCFYVSFLSGNRSSMWVVVSIFIATNEWKEAHVCLSNTSTSLHVDVLDKQTVMHYLQVNWHDTFVALSEVQVRVNNTSM